MLLVAITEGSAVHRDMHAGPDLRIVGTEVDEASTVSVLSWPASGVTGVFAGPPMPPGARAIPVPPRNQYARVRVANDPGRRVGECARQIVATISFFSDAGEPLLSPIVGRWAEKPQRA
ncbi:MAG: hypothetical protein ACYCXW_15330, partial [Solirubrobacteraceae bacterium]